MVNTSYTPNNYGEISTYSVTVGSTPLVTCFYESLEPRDNLGRIQDISCSDTPLQSFHYDSVGQLTRVDSGGVTTLYDYDNNGNRLTHNGHGGYNEVYDEQDRLKSDANWQYAYSDNGYLAKKINIADKSYITFDYDSFGSLREVNKYPVGAADLTATPPPTTSIEYVIDAENRRVGRIVDRTFDKGLIYLDGIRPAAQLDGSGNIVSIFAYGSKPNSPDLIIQGSTTYRVISDHVGSPLYIIDTGTGEIVQQLSYDAWGQMTVVHVKQGFSQPFGFAGGLYDELTGLVRFGARDYDPGTGRWTDKDPIRFKGGQSNFYVYCGNDPVNKIDPNGLDVYSAGIDASLIFGAGGGLGAGVYVSTGDAWDVGVYSSSSLGTGWNNGVAGVASHVNSMDNFSGTSMCVGGGIGKSGGGGIFTPNWDRTGTYVSFGPGLSPVSGSITQTNTSTYGLRNLASDVTNAITNSVYGFMNYMSPGSIP